jgi:hypothetical protein
VLRSVYGWSGEQDQLLWLSGRSVRCAIDLPAAQPTFTSRREPAMTDDQHVPGDDLVITPGGPFNRKPHKDEESPFSS